MTDPLLAPDEPPPFLGENLDGKSAFVLVCEHGGRRLPRALGDLGLDEAARTAHIAVDLGALGLARALAARLDAPLAHQPYSRLVCDCNRRPDVASFIPELGEGLVIPGNQNLQPEEWERRRDAIWRPFHASLAALLERRRLAGLATLLVSIHSFTPVFLGKARPWQAGILFERNRDLAPSLLSLMHTSLGDLVGDNQPYRMSRQDDFTIPVHGEDRGLPCAEIEVRNDQLAEAVGRETWAERLEESLEAAASACGLPLKALPNKKEGILAGRIP